MSKIPEKNQWFPVATSADLPFRHVFHGKLLGQELALWRADDGFVNIWQNRCLHRGVRLSIGINDGRELKCQYHGWRYSNRSAGCTYIPAHPADAPARTIKNRTFPVVEKHGLIWTCLEETTDFPNFADLEDVDCQELRNLPFRARAQLVSDALRTYEFDLVTQASSHTSKNEIVSADEYSVVLKSIQDEQTARIFFFLQPVDSDSTVVRCLLDRKLDESERNATLLYHANKLTVLRNVVEEKAAAQPAPEQFEPEFERVPAEIASIPEDTTPEAQSSLRVKVSRKWLAAEGIAGFELEALSGDLPVAQPGAHIDVQMPNGMTRQYSVVNGPGEGHAYTIGVKLEPKSKGGSKCMHDAVRVGDVLAISAPRSNFPLRRDAGKTLFIAGGIGITPLLAMAQTLENQKLQFELHYFVQGENHLAFSDRLETLGSGLIPHLGLNPQETGYGIRQSLSGYQAGFHVYLCGPGPMLTAARKIASEQGWPDESVHFEYFKNASEIDTSSSFEVALARSGVTLQIPAGKSILDVMRENHVAAPSSCEQGACGTCLASVIEGEPLHQDVFLNDAEKKAGNKIMLCVSRAKSARLILDM